MIASFSIDRERKNPGQKSQKTRGKKSGDFGLFFFLAGAEKKCRAVRREESSVVQTEMKKFFHFPVTDQIFSFYGISPEQFHEDAVRNTQRIFPAVLQPLMAEINELTRIGEDSSGLSHPENEGIPAVQILRNNYGLYGASAVLNPEVMERCGREIGENFYLLPSSIHEMLLIPESQALERRELQDIVKNGMEILILDASAACHMPDVLEMPYLPPLLGTDETEENGITVRLGGPTCLSGDVIGDYKFRQLPQYGDLLMFGDMAIYTTCKNNTFNGMPLPNIWLRRADNTMQQLTDFGYMDFKERLGSRE